MHKFTDADEREWSLRITIGAVERVKAEFEGRVDLLKLEAGDPPLGAQLEGDPALLCHVIYVLVKPQRSEIDQAAFCEVIDAAAFLEATEAFWQELTDFFRTLGRIDLCRLIEAQKQVAGRTWEKNVAQIEVNVQKALAMTAGGSSGASPESAESTPGP